jgi:SAM-dependent methyltransferase
MPLIAHDIYASGPMHALLRDEVAAMAPELARCKGEHALRVAVSDATSLPPLPLLGHWASLRVRGDIFTGDIQASTVSSLPFADDAFGVVLLSHVLEVATHPESLLVEAVRVLEPGGTLAITGIHPLGGWAPWMLWRARSPRLVWPWWLRQRLLAATMEPLSLHRAGSLFPDAARESRGAAVLGGGYVLLARKKRLSTLPLRVRQAPAAAPMQGSLASGARRSGSR